jgi:hypothetical protein
MRKTPNWWEIGKRFQTLVIFGRNLRQVIMPDRTQRVCSAWVSPPPDVGLLVATVFCLQALGHSALPNYKLTEELVWNRPQPSRLFEECMGGCNPTQKARKSGFFASARHKFTAPNHPGVLNQEGAVVFGKKKAVAAYVQTQPPCYPLEILAPAPWLNRILIPNIQTHSSILVAGFSGLLALLWVFWAAHGSLKWR